MPRTAPFALLCLLSACDQDEFGEGFRLDSDQRRDLFVQVDPQPVDVLWVVDTSCSMTDEQESLAANFPAFAEFFEESGLSYQMGVTSTDILEEDTAESLDGRLNGNPGVVTPFMPSLAVEFGNRALMGITEGHDDEKGLHAAYVAAGALTDVGQPNHDLMREEANLAIVVVSDEPDYSTLGELDSDTFIGAPAFATWLDARKGDPERSSLSGIVGVPDGSNELGCNIDAQSQWNWNGARTGDGYIEAIEATGGLLQSICEDDWREILSRMGLIVAGLHESFTLNDVVDPETIVVIVDGRDPGAWEFLPAKNAIHFLDAGSIPRPGDEIRVTYRIPTD